MISLSKSGACNSASRKKYTMLCLLLFSAIASFAAFADPQLGKDPLDDVVAALTFEEKIKLVRGTGMRIPGVDGPSVGETDEEKVPGAAGTTFAVPRLGIPSIVLADGPAGLRIQPVRKSDPDNTYYCTAFPIATLLASSWDPALLENVGKAVGEEVKEYGVDILLAPGMNIQRYPLGGRNFEYYSEDPILTGKMAAAMVRGVQSQGVGTAIKHFVANNHEWNRDKISVEVEEKALREIYLKGFEIAVKESRPWTVMSSYNKVNGEYTSESHRLLTDILRKQWGFEGFVMTDWFGGVDAEKQIEAGNDLLMPGTDGQEQALLAAGKANTLDREALDRSVKNILNVVMKTPAFKRYRYSNRPNLKQHSQVARRAAAEGMVLLENKQRTLPLKPAAKLALFGNTSYRVITGGTGSGDVNEAYSISLLDGLPNQGFPVDQILATTYKNYIEAELAKQPVRTGIEAFLPVKPITEALIAPVDIQRAAAKNDVAIVTIGRSSGEFSDRDKSDFSLTAEEIRLLEDVAVGFHEKNKPVVVILNIGGAIDVASWRDKVDAILLAWQPGQEAGNAIGDLLAGKMAPSGKLSGTFPVSLAQYPADKNFPGVVKDPAAKPQGLMRSVPAEVVYDEGARVGYRHFNRTEEPVAYPFGYGLSYTDFDYSNVKLGKTSGDGNIAITLSVKNTGQYSGKEIVQLYVSRRDGKAYPYGTELHDFVKTGLLKPGATQTVTLHVNSDKLSRYDEGRGGWRAEKGKYDILIGSSSRHIAYKDHFDLKKSIWTR